MSLPTALFDYDLPPTLIAQEPAEPRDSSRLLVLNRLTGTIEHRHFRDLVDYLHPPDVLVTNDSRVLPARLRARKPTGGELEILLLRQTDDVGLEWQALVRGRGLKPGSSLILTGGGVLATVLAVETSGARLLRFSQPASHWLHDLGETPLPPYITRYHGDPERYQTVYSRAEGSAAAPTAGLHFTPELLLALKRSGVAMEQVTLHVGLDTFRPVEAEHIDDHIIHTEWATITAPTARIVNQTTLAGGKVVAVGTTAVRTLEWGATAAQAIDPYASPESCPWQRVSAFAGPVSLFIRPGYHFRAVDALVTNFHLPRSSLLMLASAFVQQGAGGEPDVGRRLLLRTYEEAKREGYRFFSFGDAMLIL